MDFPAALLPFLRRRFFTTYIRSLPSLSFREAHVIDLCLEGLQGGDCNFEVTNFVIAPDKGLRYTIKL